MNTKFTAFYSYKGGVGRSLALANLAFLYANSGKKVLIIDMDMEAPGQHKTELFDKQFKKNNNTNGIIELLQSYMEFRKNLSGINKSEISFSELWPLRDFISKSIAFTNHIDSAGNSESKKNKAKKSGGIWLMPAGANLNDAYSKYLATLGDWDWKAFYEESGDSFFTLLKDEIISHGFEEVLIDCRTGYSDIFYAATLLLAETLVCVTAFNNQSIEGTKNILQILANKNIRNRYGEKDILLVGSPLPDIEESRIREREAEIHQEWSEFRGWDGILHYHPELALREKILTMDDDVIPKNNRVPYVQDILRLFDKLNDSDKLKSSAVFEHSPLPENPFFAIRVEYLKPSQIYNDFVDPGNVIYESLQEYMPVIVSGSRGTGKTMLARRLDYETTICQLESEGKLLHPDTMKQIGLWFCLDVDFLGAFIPNKENDPNNEIMFRLSLDILILQKALIALHKCGGIDVWCTNPKKLFIQLGKELDSKKEITNYESLKDVIEDKLRDIRSYINNPIIKNRPVVFQDNILMKILVENLLENKDNFDNYFVIYLDEYENFYEFQQRVINTRIKKVKKSDCVTYKVFTRNGGIRTHETTLPNQLIEDTHDYRFYNLDENITFQEFKKHITAIVQKLLTNSDYFRLYKMTDPEKLFTGLSTEDEIDKLIQADKGKRLIKWLENNHNAKVNKKLLVWFKTETSFKRKLVASVIINQGKNVDVVISSFEKNDQNSKDWLHNYSEGAMYWLYTLYSTKKIYSGFNDIIGISGNNTRMALNFCFSIMKLWIIENKDKDKDKDKDKLSISINIQNTGINEQSDLQFRNIKSNYGKDAKFIYLFVRRIGRLFELIHKGPRQGEPEINHFMIKDDDKLTDKEKDLLKYCRYESVLRWLPGNKQKTNADYQKDAYQLNPRYAPYFGISWRRKKCLTFTPADIKVLFSEDEGKWNKLVKKIENKYITITKNNQTSYDMFDDSNER